MKQLLFLILSSLLTTYSQVGQAQVALNYGVELGIAFSQLPKTNSYNIKIRNDKVTEKTAPLLSPLIGLTSELRIKKHLYFAVGLQYQKSGQRYHYHRDGNDLLYGGTYRSDTWENLTIHKICLPISIGYSFKLWKLKPTLFIGFRPCNFLAGKHYTKNKFDHDISSKDITNENVFNPLAVNETGYRNIQRNQNQLSVGVNTLINQHLKFSVSFHSGAQLYYAENSTSCFGYSLHNNDCVVSMAYLFSSPKQDK